MNKPGKLASFFLLSPLSLLYGSITGIRNTLFNLKILPSQEFNTPIICIGNIAVGGTGKTPHSEYIIKELEKDFKIAYVSRGYKRKTRGFQLASLDSTSREIGDEARQIKQKYPNTIVAVDGNRRRAINKLEKSANSPDIIILDDAFQHRYVKADINILLTDEEKPFYEDNIMPLGRLREYSSSKNRANIIIVTKCNPQITPIEKRIILNNLGLKPYQSLYFTTMKYGDIKPVFSKEVSSIESFSQYTSYIVTGIAKPKPLLERCKKLFKKTHHISFPDHHNFTKNDIKNIQDKFVSDSSQHKCILTTEKDAMRLQGMDLPEEIKKSMYYIPIEPSFIDNNEEKLIKWIKEYVTKNKEMRILY